MISSNSLPSVLLLGLALGSAGSLTGYAQETSMGAPPNILVIQREFIKPGRAGALHEKTEGAFVKAMREHHGSARYIGLVSYSGVSRALFLNGYPDLAAWQKDSDAMTSDPALAADIENASVADGDLLTSYEQSVWRYRPELSRRPGVNRGDRYMEILQFTVRPGHEQQWEQMAAMISEGYKKGDPEGHWDIFQSMFGTPQSSYLVIIPLKGMADLDQDHMRSKKFEQGMGVEGLKKLDQLEAEAVESHTSNLFRFNPEMSYPPEKWITADPDFWSARPHGDDHPGGGTQ